MSDVTVLADAARYVDAKLPPGNPHLDDPLWCAFVFREAAAKATQEETVAQAVLSKARERRVAMDTAYQQAIGELRNKL